MRQTVGISAVGFRDFSDMVMIAEWVVCTSHSDEWAEQERIHLVFSNINGTELHVTMGTEERSIDSVSVTCPAPEGVKTVDWLHDLRAFMNCLFVIGGWRISEEHNAGKDTLAVVYERNKS